MPFTFNRDKQKPSDKLGGDDFLSGIRKQFDQDRKMFFDKNPAWETTTPSASGFSRGGFFDDERGGLGIRSHLDDLAQRHPEFASSLRRGPGWAGEPMAGQHSQHEPMGAQHESAGSQHEPMGAQHEQHRGDASSHTDAGPAPGSEADQSERRDEAGPLRGRTRLAATATDVPNHGLGGDTESRGQRSWSAPPDSRAPPPAAPSRFVSRLDFQPTAANQTEAQQTQSQPQQTQPPPSTGQPESGPKPAAVRHIPIFVEGRDEPLVARERPVPSHEPFPRQPPHQEPVQRQEPVGTGPQPARSFNASPQPFRSNASAGAGPKTAPPAAPAAPQAAPAAPAASAAPVAAPLDGLARVGLVASAVEELRLQVQAHAGGGLRSDKQYVLLDELLTRRLLELDDIEPNGREDVRNARRQAIRAVQDCISQLEAKVPLPADCPPAETNQSDVSDPPPATDAPAS